MIVVGAILAWLFSDVDARLYGPRFGSVTAIALHVGLTGALSLLLCVIVTWRERPRSHALGLVRVPLGESIAWGLAGVLGSYVLASLGVGVYLLARALLPHEAHAALATAPPTFEAPGGVVGDELANKARWAAELGKIPLGVALGIAIFAGFYEEVVFRGFVLGRLRIVFGAGKWPTVAAIVVSSIFFAAGHGYQGGMGLAQTFLAGIALATLAAYRRSIWPSVVAHALIDSIGLVALHVLRPILEQLQRHAT